MNAANTPLALIHNVNFKILSADFKLETKYIALLKKKKFLKMILKNILMTIITLSKKWILSGVL